MADGIETPEAPEVDDIEADVRAAMELHNPEGAGDEQISNEEHEPDTRSEGAEAKEQPEQSVSEAAKTLAKSRKRPGKALAAETAPAQAERIDPPHAWDVEAKEEFNKLPPVAQKQSLEFWKKTQGTITRTQQEVARLHQRYSTIDQTVSHYLPQWNLNGYTPERVVAELAANQHLIQTKGIDGWLEVLERSGVTPEDLVAHKTGRGTTSAQHTGVAQQNYLTQEHVAQIVEARLQEERRQREAELYQQQVQQAAQPLLAMQRMVDSDGKYLYREIQPDSRDLPWVESLVKDIREINPALSLEAATKQAIAEVRAIKAMRSGSPSSSDPRLNREQEIARVRTASLSMRGRGNGAVSTETFEAAGNETVEQSVRRAMQQLNSH